jgi:hypothetical protein
MIDDALALGVKHATLNISLGQLIEPAAKADSIRFTSDAREFSFNRNAVTNLDARVKQLSDAGAVVYFILLAYETHDAEKDALLLHPLYDRAAKTHGLGAFNTATPDGLAWFRATMEFLAQRYSGADAAHGRVWGWIVGNEVDSHWFWYNIGDASLEKIAGEYERAVRVVHDAVRKFSANARVYISLDHFWARRYDLNAPLHTAPGRDLLDTFAKLARERGDFDWHVAHHPYPDNLLDPHFWLDKNAPQSDDAPVVSFKNLEVLTRHLARPELLWHGQPRHVILSEQGFHCADKPDGERDQAAAFCFAWEKVARIPGIDAFILHRHVDHAQEGVSLGLWTTKPGKVCEADRRRAIYEAFRAAGTPEQARAFGFALPVVGAKTWDEAVASLAK